MAKTPADFTIDEWITLRVKLLSQVISSKCDTTVTVRALARKLKVPQNIVCTLTEDQPGLDISIGVSTGGGIYLEGNVGDYIVEFCDSHGITEDFNESDASRFQFTINHINVPNYEKIN